ncbi:hypothetical protein EIP86_006734 [Pleurotus ostreatoroseus]|nr:hypothetical protein EIP86_006734 [Pleurotus ostreatoroseus]
MTRPPIPRYQPKALVPPTVTLNVLLVAIAKRVEGIYSRNMERGTPLTLVGSFDGTDAEETEGNSEYEATSEEDELCDNTDAPHGAVERHGDHITDHSSSPVRHSPVTNARALADTTEPCTTSGLETVQEVASNTTIRDATPKLDPSPAVIAGEKSQGPTQEETRDDPSASSVEERPAKGKKSRKSKKSKGKKTKDKSNDGPLQDPPDLSVIEERQRPKLCGFSDCVACYPTPANAGNEPLHPKGKPIWCGWCDKLFHDRTEHQLHLTVDPHRLAKTGIDRMEKNAQKQVKCRWPGCTLWISADSSSLKKHTTSIHTEAPMYHDLCGRRRARDEEVEVVENEDDTESNREAGEASGEEENVPITESPSRRARGHRTKTKGKGRVANGRKAAATKKSRPADSSKRARELKDDEDYVDDFEADDESVGVAPRRGGAKRRRC